MEAGAILVKRGLLSSQQLDQLRRERPDVNRLDVAAVDSGMVSEEDALRALGDEVGIPYVDLEQTTIDLSLLRGFPQKLIHRHLLFPIDQHNGSLTVATSDPFDLYPLDELSVVTGLTIAPVLASREQIARQIPHEGQLRRHGEMRAELSGLARGFGHKRTVACEVADERIDLEERDFHSVYARSHFSLT